MIKTKDDEKFMKMWEKRRNHKAMFLLIFALFWAIFVGGLTALLMNLVQGQEYMWINFAIYGSVNAIIVLLINRGQLMINSFNVLLL